MRNILNAQKQGAKAQRLFEANLGCIFFDNPLGLLYLHSPTDQLCPFAKLTTHVYRYSNICISINRCGPLSKHRDLRKRDYYREEDKNPEALC